MAKREKIMKIFELLSKDCEGGDWYVLIRGTYEECYDYRSMDEAEQDKPARFSFVNIILLLLVNYAKIDTSKPAVKRV
jgi:hypothetical protein